MRFEWDENKSRANQIKHGLNFGKAIEVFNDPNRVSGFENSYGDEDRWSIIGFTTDLALLVVIHMFPDEYEPDLIRIISARPATKTERKFYATENGQILRS